MTEESSFLKDIYMGLQSIANESFPRTCPNCKTEYLTQEDFIEKTQMIRGQSGLMESIDDDDNPIVELYRNCPCGSTMVEFFQERRDMSPAGLRRREQFGKLMDMLVEKGLDINTARQELLSVLKGKSSPILEEMGIRYE